MKRSALSRQRVIYTALALAGGVLAGWFLWDRTTPPEVAHRPNSYIQPLESTPGDLAGTSLAAAQLPPLPPSRFLNTSAAARYVGMASCIECHDEQHESYLHTNHSRAFGDVQLSTAPADGKFDHAPSGRSYRVYRRDGQLRHEESLVAEGEEPLMLADFPLRYVVGSGAHALSYVVEVEGFLFESPISWYASRQSWDLSPGYDKLNAGFARPVYYDCLYCHIGRAEAIDGNRNRVAIHAKAIDCESCHGPGSLHVERRRGNHVAIEGTVDGDDGADLTIVNPTRLPRELAESICLQCHLHGDAEVDMRGRGIGEFRPGRRLQDYRIHDALQALDKSMLLDGHGEQMQLSACYQQSSTMTCTTCHDPHAIPAAGQLVDYFKSKCTSCHEIEACGLPMPERLKKSPQDNCVACHMPAVATEAPHIAATHHRIGVHSETTAGPMAATGDVLEPLSDVTHLPQIEQQRCLGLAYAELTVRQSDPQSGDHYRRQARDILADVDTRGLSDPHIVAALAKMLQQEDPDQSVELAQTALRYIPLPAEARIDALTTLSNVYMTRQQTNLAAAPLEDLVKLRRRAGDWFALGICRYQAGDIEGAAQAVEQAAAIQPDRPQIHALLAELNGRSGRDELARRHQRLLQILTKRQGGSQSQQ